MQFAYPATLTPAPSGGCTAIFRERPEVITQGETLAEALLEVADCLPGAVAARIGGREEQEKRPPGDAHGQSLECLVERRPDDLQAPRHQVHSDRVARGERSLAGS